MTDAQRISAQLLELERAIHGKAMTDEQFARWQNLVVDWMAVARDGNEKRRFLRFSLEHRVRLRVGEECREVKLVEIGSFGLRIKGDLGRGFRPGQDVRWEAIEIDGRWIDIGAECQVARKPGRWVAGLTLTTKDPKVRKRIRRTTYYPAYMNALEAMAQGTAAA